MASYWTRYSSSEGEFFEGEEEELEEEEEEIRRLEDDVSEEEVLDLQSEDELGEEDIEALEIELRYERVASGYGYGRIDAMDSRTSVSNAHDRIAHALLVFAGWKR
jgi:hypothetical protein